MKKKKKGEGKWYRYEQGGNFYPAEYPFEADEKEYWYKERCEENLKDGDIYIYRVRYLLGEKMYQIGEIIYHEPEYRYEHKIFMKMNGQTEVAKINFLVFDTVDTVVGDDLLDVLEKKLEEFDNKSDFDRKIHDMRLLNLVDKKTKQGVPLTREELRFLYEIDNKVEYINSNKDYRIGKIIARRKSIAEDMNRIYDFKRISEYLDDLNLDVVKDPAGLQLPEITGNISLHGLEKTAGLKLPKIVKGDLTVAGVTESSHVVFPKIVEGSLTIFDVIIPYDIPPLSELEINYSTPKQVVGAKQLTLPEVVKGNLYIDVFIKDFEYLTLPEIGGCLSILCSEKAEGLILPQIMKENVSLKNLISAEGVLFSEEIDGCLCLDSLKDTNGLIVPKSAKDKIKCKINIPDSCFMEDDDYKKYRQNLLYRLKATKEICKEYNVSEDEIAFTVNECKQKKGQIKILKDDVNLNKVLDNGDLNVLPEIIIGDVNLKEKTYLNNFTFKSNVVGNLNFSGLVSAKKVILSDGVRGSVSLSNLTEVKELVLPRIIEKNLIMNKLKEINGNVIFSKMIGGTVDLSSLVSVESVNFSETIQGDLKLLALEYINNSSLPKFVGKSFIMSSLKKTTSLILPKMVGEGVFLSSLSEFDYLELSQAINGSLCLDSLKDTNGLIVPKSAKDKIKCKINIPDSCFMEDDDYKKYRQNLLYRLKATKEICKEYNVSEDEIAFTVNECKQKKGQIKILKDDVNLNKVLDNGDLNVLPEIIIGDVNLKEKTYLNNFTFKSNVVGNLNFSGLVSAKKVILSDGVRGSVSLSNLTEVKELVLPRIIEKNLIMNKLKEINGNVIFSKMIGGTVDLSSLVSVESVNFSETIQGDLKLLALEYINNSSLPKFVGKSFIMSSLKKTTSLILPKMVGEGVFLSSLSEFDYLELPQAINGSLSLEGLKSADGLIFPEVVTKSVYLNNLKSLTNSKLPRVVGRHLNMENLLEINNSQLPSIINGDLLLRRLKTTDKLSLPSIINGDVELGSLTDVDTLILSKYIGGDLNLCSLKNAREVVFPEVINKETWLGNFDKEDVKLPASLKEKILTKNVPYDCFIADDEYKEYRSARVEELNTIKPPENVSKIKKLTRRLTDHS